MQTPQMRVYRTRAAPQAARAKTNPARPMHDAAAAPQSSQIVIQRTRPCEAIGRDRTKNPALRQGFLKIGSPGWIRTTECLSQSQVPYRLATGL